MNNRPLITTLLILGLLGLGAWLSSRGLAQHPVKAIVFRLTPGLATADSSLVEAFEVSAPLEGKEAQVQAFRLPGNLQTSLKQALTQKSISQLLSVTKSLGSWPLVVGMTGDGEGWPWYFGGGIKGFLGETSESFFDNLNVWDRLYLSFNWPVPPPAPFTATIPLDGLVANTQPSTTPEVTSPALVPTPEAFKGEVRLEILNGCGITNAADWVARRVKGPGLMVTGTTNADNFHYSHTVLQTAVGVPVALAEVLDRLGLTQDSVQEVPSLPPPNDAVLIVGRDYRKLKERRHDRLHH